LSKDTFVFLSNPALVFEK